MRPVVFTTCTNRKRREPVSELCARTLEAAAVDALASEWCGRLARSTDRVRARDLYCGRGFREAERAGEIAGGRLVVVSAGLGPVEADCAIPSYNMTLTRSSDDSVLTKLRVPESAWWAELVVRSPFAADEVDSGGLILAALSRPYLDLVAEQWSRWPAERLSRLRVFCRDTSRGLPDAVGPAVMPYDDRLEQLGGGYAGTKGDFAQRALRHFVQAFGADASVPAREHARQVSERFEGLSVAPAPRRPRLTDGALIDLIVREWDVVGGRSGEMLRRLRRGLGVACEQSRFKSLFQQAAALRSRSPL